MSLRQRKVREIIPGDSGGLPIEPRSKVGVETEPFVAADESPVGTDPEHGPFLAALAFQRELVLEEDEFLTLPRKHILDTCIHAPPAAAPRT